MPRIENGRVWIGGAALLALLTAGLGYLLLIGPQRAHTDSVRADVASTTFQGTSLQARITGLAAQSKRISAYRTALAHAQRALPGADDVTATPQLLRALAAEATATSTTITALTVGDPASVTPTAPAPAATGSASAPAAAPTGTSPLSAIALGATVTGSRTNLFHFLGDLQSTQPRALLVTAVTVSSGNEAEGPTASMKLTMTAFVRSIAAATPAGRVTPAAAPGSGG